MPNGQPCRLSTRARHTRQIHIVVSAFRGSTVRRLASIQGRCELHGKAANTVIRKKKHGRARVSCAARWARGIVCVVSVPGSQRICPAKEHTETWERDCAYEDLGGRPGTGGMEGTGGTCGVWRGRCSFRFSTSFACASRSAARLFSACSCCAMKSEVFGLRRELSVVARRTHARNGVPHSEDSQDGLPVADFLFLLLRLLLLAVLDRAEVALLIHALRTFLDRG